MASRLRVACWVFVLGIILGFVAPRQSSADCCSCSVLGAPACRSNTADCSSTPPYLQCGPVVSGGLCVGAICEATAQAPAIGSPSSPIFGLTAMALLVAGLVLLLRRSLRD